MDIEHGAIIAIIEHKMLPDFIDRRVTPEFFHDIEHRKIYGMLLQHWRDYRQHPTKDAVAKPYPTYDLDVALDDAPEWYLDELVDAYRRRSVYQLLRDLNEEAEKEDVREGYRLESMLRRGLNDIAIETTSGRSVDFFDTVFQDRYLELLQTIMDNPGSLRGISTGFSTIDRATGGLQPQQLITVAGVPKAGKSAIALAIAYAARMSAKNVLFFTFEMSVEEQEHRLTSIITGMSLTGLLEGRFTPAKLRDIRKTMATFSGGTAFTISADISAMTTLDAVNARILQHSPDVVIIDGAYLLDPDDPKIQVMSPQHLTKITRGAKRMAQRLNLPVIITTQAIISRSRKGLDMGSVGYSSSFAQDSDVLLGVEPMLEGGPKGTISRLKVLASRSGPKAEAFLRVDWSSGTISEITEEDAESMGGLSGKHDSTGLWEGGDGEEGPRHRGDPGRSQRRRRSA